MNNALLLIDIQNDYFPGGKAALHAPLAAAENARLLLESYRKTERDIIHVQHVSTRPGATFFLPNTHGAEIHASVAPLAGETVVVKHFPNSFRETGLLELLKSRNTDSLTVAGMMTHMCVDTTVRAAADFGFRVTLAGDACATKALQFGGEHATAEQVQTAYLAALSGSFASIDSAANIAATVS